MKQPSDAAAATRTSNPRRLLTPSAPEVSQSGALPPPGHRFTHVCSPPQNNKQTNETNRQSALIPQPLPSAGSSSRSDRGAPSSACLSLSLSAFACSLSPARGGTRVLTPPAPRPRLRCVHAKRGQNNKRRNNRRNLRRRDFFVALANRKLMKHVDLKPQNDWLSRLSVKFRFFSLSRTEVKRLQDRLKKKGETRKQTKTVHLP